MNAEEMIELSRLLMEDWHLYEEASIVLRWARELFPEEEGVTALLVEALTKSGQDEAARKLSNEIPPPDDTDDLVTHALAQAAAFDHTKAIEFLGRAIALSPGEERLYSRRGLIRFGMGAYDEAGHDLVRALAIGLWTPKPEPDFAPLLRGFKKIRSEVEGDPLGFRLIDVWAKLSTKKVHAAKALLAKIKEDHWAVHALRAVAAGRHLSVEKKHLKLAMAKGPDEITLYLRYVRADHDDFPSQEQIVRLAPDWAQARVDAASACLRARQLDKALEHAEAAVEKFPELYIAIKVRADVLAKRHEFERALADYDDLVDSFDDEEKPEDDDWDGQEWRDELNALRCARGKLRFKMRDLEGAREDFDLACSLERKDGCWSFFERARFLAMMGEREKALVDLNRSLGRVEWLPGLSLRWRVRAKLGDKKGAEADHEHLIRIKKQRAESMKELTGPPKKAEKKRPEKKKPARKKPAKKKKKKKST